MIYLKIMKILRAVAHVSLGTLLLTTTSQMVHAERSLKTDGFITATFSQVDSEVPYSGGISDDINFSQGSLIGVQSTFKPSDEPVEFVVQLLALGEKNWEVNAEWAYVGYKPSDNWEFKAGAIRVPFFLVSEYFHVGVIYPWVRPPKELHFIPFTSIDGASGKYKNYWGDIDYSLQVYVGSEQELTLEFAGLSLSADGFQAVGIVGNISSEQLHLRIAYHDMSDFGLDVASALTSIVTPAAAAAVAASGLPIPTGFSEISLFTIGLAYTKNHLTVQGEWNTYSLPKFSMFPDADAAYVTLAYSLGAFTPHISYSYYDAREDTIVNLAQSTVMTGVRMEVNPAVAVKVEIGQSTLDDAPFTLGFYDMLPAPLGTATLDDQLWIFNASISMVF
jgi:Gram-negative porin